MGLTQNRVPRSFVMFKTHVAIANVKALSWPVLILHIAQHFDSLTFPGYLVSCLPRDQGRLLYHVPYSLFQERMAP